MVSCARATRGLRRPSLDTRSGRPSSPPSREKIEERWSLEARNRGSTRLPFLLPTLAICSQGTVEGFGRRGGMIFVERVQWVLGIELVEGIVGVTRVVLIHRIRGVAGIVVIDRVQRILRIVGVDRIQRIIGTVLVERVEDIVVALVLLREAGFGKRMRGEEEETEDPDHPQGEIHRSGTASSLSLLPWSIRAQAGQKRFRHLYIFIERPPNVPLHVGAGDGFFWGELAGLRRSPMCSSACNSSG